MMIARKVSIWAKNRFILLVAALTLIAACGGGAAPAASSSNSTVYTIRYVGIQAQTDPHTIAQFKFKDDVEKQSHGRIKVEVFYFQQYANGNLTDITSQAKLGVIQMVDTAPATLSQYDPNMGILAMPFLFNDDRKALAALDGKGGQMLSASLSQTGGFKLLAWQDNGPRNIAMAKAPVRSLADLKGKKMRVIASEVTLSTYRALGANPVGMNLSEVPSALSSGVIDGLDMPIVPMVGLQAYNYAPYYTLSGTSFEVIATVMNKSFWDSLPADLQKIVATAETNATNYQRDANIAAETSGLDVLKQKGATIITLDPTELGKFKAAVSPIYDDWRAKHGASILAALQSGI
jgi:tripartite ATP-independent transporter DctP family solute receptor